MPPQKKWSPSEDFTVEMSQATTDTEEEEHLREEKSCTKVQKW